jgi:UDP-N-acetylmuramoyl-tripeptide--D-alanyl-D-alanine ligase
VDLTRDQIVTITGGRAHGANDGAGPPVARGFGFDSRTLVAGAGFVALHDVRDGHDFVGDAFARGASLALVEHAPPGVDGPLVIVDDTRAALRALAVAARERLTPAVVIGITGSAGKTSTKDLTAAALRPGFAVHASAASFNNEIGLPVTLLSAPEGTEAVVLEMGARFAGNIHELCAIAVPVIGVITNVGLAHAEHLGGPTGIAAVKGELLDALPAGGLAVLDADSDHLPALRVRSAAPVLTVGSGAAADVRISEVRLDADLRPTFRLDSPWGSAESVSLAVRGSYQAANAAQAATVALHLGVPLDAVVAALGGAATAAWRMELAAAPEGFVVLNDSYNASPTSMRAALESFAQLPVAGRRIAVLGEMRELGELSAREHRRLGELVADADVVALVVVGTGTDELAAAAAARGVEVHDVADPEAAVAIVRKLARPDDAVLIKASRAVGLERVAQSLTVGTADAGRDVR